MSGQIASRLGYYKGLIIGGLVLMMGGFLLLSTLNADTPYIRVILYMIVLGLGIGPALPLFNLAIQNAVKPWEIGVATSSGQFFQQLGSVVGTAVFGAVLSSGLVSNADKSFKDVEVGQPPAVVAQLEGVRKGFGSGSASNSRAGTAAPTFEQVSKGISAGFTQQYGVIEAAVKSGDPAKFSALKTDQTLPAGLRQGLSNVPAQAIASPQGQLGVLARLKTGLDTAQAAVLKDAKTSYDLSARAVKVTFATTISRIYLISIFVALLALLAVLPMPNLKMPTRSKGDGSGGEKSSGLAAMEG